MFKLRAANLNWEMNSFPGDLSTRLTILYEYINKIILF